MANTSSASLLHEFQELRPSENYSNTYTSEYLDPTHQHAECWYPRWPKGFIDWQHSSRVIRIGSFVVWTLLAFTAASLCTAIYLMARDLTAEEPTYPPDSPEFPFYKNAAFLNCSSVRVKPVDCKALKNMLVDTRLGNVLATQIYEMGQPEGINSWCTAMQCFKGYKVIPSQPYPSAHIPNDFSVWVSFNIATLSLLWSLKGYLQSAQRSRGGIRHLAGALRWPL